MHFRNQGRALRGQSPARPAARPRAVVDKAAGFIGPHQVEGGVARGDAVRRDAALVEHARDRGGRPSRASIASEERTQLGRDTVIVRQGTLSFSGLRSGDFLGRMERFGKPGFTIMSDYGKCVFRERE